MEMNKILERWKKVGNIKKKNNNNKDEIKKCK